MCRNDRFVGHSLTLRILLIAGFGLCALLGSASAQNADDQDQAAPDASAQSDAEVSISRQLSDFLHFAMIGKFELARDVYGQPLLERPELNPLTDEAADELVQYADQHENLIDTLLLLVNNDTVSDTAKNILDLVRQAHSRKSSNPDEIKDSIDLLAGDPMQRTVGLQRLQESGEYAVPWLLQKLADPDAENRYPYIARALPQLGKGAVDPLIAALATDNIAIRSLVVETLGKLGYPQALPYLVRIANDQEAGNSVREAALRAIKQITGRDQELALFSTVTLLNELAVKYYDEADSVMPDPTAPQTNVWYYNKEAGPRETMIRFVEVPREIFGMVMCMRVCVESLEMQSEQPKTLAMFLAANFRREARLAMAVDSAEPVDQQGMDPTRPDNWLRSLYLARIAGPRYCQIALGMAMHNFDQPVALGAVAALNDTAGATSLIEQLDPAGMTLAQALQFPDLVVRVRAALALGQAAPKVEFKGADEVVPLLASTLQFEGTKYYIVIDPDEQSREAIASALSRGGAEVLAKARLNEAMIQARENWTHADAIFLATDMERPTAPAAIQELKNDTKFGLAPVVLMVKKEGTIVANNVEKIDPRVGSVLILTKEGQTDEKLPDLLVEEAQRVAPEYGHQDMSAELAAELAMESARTLGQLARTNGHVFEVMPAQAALIETLAKADTDLRLAAMHVLAWLNSADAQQAIARVTLDDNEDEAMRQEAFIDLAASARRYGNLLTDKHTDALIELALNGENDNMRTHAGMVVGAINLPPTKATEMILSQTR